MLDPPSIPAIRCVHVNPAVSETPVTVPKFVQTKTTITSFVFVVLSVNVAEAAEPLPETEESTDRDGAAAGGGIRAGDSFVAARNACPT
jgi:hypothetical protein